MPSPPSQQLQSEAVLQLLWQLQELFAEPEQQQAACSIGGGSGCLVLGRLTGQCNFVQGF